MQLIDAGTFGYACHTAGLYTNGGNIQALCDVFLNNVLPGLNLVATSTPPAAVAAPLVYENVLGAVGRVDAVEKLERGANPIARGVVRPVVFAIVGEDHTDKDDLKRAEDLVRRLVGQRSPDHVLLMLERGLSNKHARFLGGASILVGDERAIHGENGSEKQRSVVIAGYVFACLSAGDQSRKDKVLILIGDNHVADLYAALVYMIGHSATAPWIARRPRAFHIMRSQA